VAAYQFPDAPPFANNRLRAFFQIAVDSHGPDDHYALASIAKRSPSEGLGSYLNLVVLSKWSSAPVIIRKVAANLWPAYLETGILPIIQPLTLSEWRRQVAYDGSTYTSIRKVGTYLYGRV
jgi:hypothetical protein